MTLLPHVSTDSVEFTLTETGYIILRQNVTVTPRNRRGLIRAQAKTVSSEISFRADEVSQLIVSLVEMYAMAVKDGSASDPNELYDL